MNAALQLKIQNTLIQQKQFFNSQKTKEVSFRVAQLQKLKKAIIANETQIINALQNDLRKSYPEAYLTEIAMVLLELDLHIKNLEKWAKPKKEKTVLQLWPSKSYTYQDPLGVALLIAPWNYPFQLVINPLIGAISAGCCAIVKPSEATPTVATVLENLISTTFEAHYICCFQGEKEVSEMLLQEKFDVIFFTGSPTVGKIVMKAAAQNLTPVILELGGKSPCIVDSSANLEIAARRIVWGKTINAGQTCIAPDYVWVAQNCKEALLVEIQKQLGKMFGDTPEDSPYYARIVHQAAFKRLTSLLHNEGTIRIGGKTNPETRYIAPTVLDNITPQSPIMQEEIFGPILPLLTFNQLKEVINHINQNEKPLAVYYFGSEKTGKTITNQTSSGGVCINDTLIHVANHHLPFGGVGNSGMGKYHGKHSFHAFSHTKSVMVSPTAIDLPFKYAPFKNFSFLKKFI